MTSVTLQYFDSCPNWQVTAERLRSVIKEKDLSVDLTYQRVETPEEAIRLDFHGSPSILIDGQDPFVTQANQVGLACRIYHTDQGMAEAPTFDQLARVLEEGSRI